MWHITEPVTVAPLTLSAVYFIYLPVSSKCLFSEDLAEYTSPQTNYGDPNQLASMKDNHPLIPIDPHLALSLNWITLDEMAMEMPYINDNVKACLKLIKDIKETEHGNDKEGL